MSLPGSPRSQDVTPGPLKPWWGQLGWVRGANGLGTWGCHLVPKAPGSLQFKAQSKAKPQGSARQFHHRVPQFLLAKQGQGFSTHGWCHGSLRTLGCKDGAGLPGDRDVAARHRQQPPQGLGCRVSSPCCVQAMLCPYSNWENIPPWWVGEDRGVRARMLSQPKSQITPCIGAELPRGSQGGQGPSEGSWGHLMTQVCLSPGCCRTACATTTSLRCWPRSQAMSTSPRATSRRSKLPSTSTAPWPSASTPHTRPSPSTPTASTMSPSAVSRVAHGAREDLGAQGDARTPGSPPWF